MAAVEVQAGYKYYGSAFSSSKKVVLDHLNMTVEHGSIYGLLGASGCGKTTLLACIVGRRKLNGGEIKVLGGQPGTKGSGVPGPRVGYMPQEIALLGDFTIAETIFYFGRISGMSESRIQDRFALLTKLLELPFADRLVSKLSGGQQRRLSFACALVHDPELLILDEPTVGLDPLLRERIWDYLINTTKTSHLAVIITTHYIEEAKMANRVGLMRNGILLAEDAPSNITNVLQVSSLEDAFLKLCMRHGQSEEAGSLIQHETMQTIPQPPIETCAPIDLAKIPTIENHIAPTHQTKQVFDFSLSQKFKALMTKNVLQILRQPASLLFCFVFPILQLSCFYLSIGGNPKDLKLGIVNEEINSYSDCFNKSLITAYAHDYECDFQKLSCRFLQQMEDDIAKKVFYNNIDEAFTASRSGEILGFLHFSKNFTESITDIQKQGTNADESSYENREILVRMDKSDQQITYFIERRLLQTFTSFNEKLMEDCGYPKNLLSVPVKFETPVYGTFNDEYTEFVAPGIMMTMVFFLATLGTSTLFITERLEGVWDRILVIGITTNEMLGAHILTQLCVIIIQCGEILYLAGFVYGTENKGDTFTIIVLLVLLGVAGMLFGLLISIFCNSHTTASFLATGFFYPMIILCGLLWPLEGMPVGLKYFSLAFPFTIPSITMRNVIVKGWSITNFDVYSGFGVLVIWIIIFAVLCVLGLRLKK